MDHYGYDNDESDFGFQYPDWPGKIPGFKGKYRKMYSYLNS
jgi:hypothetical protein